MFLKEKIREARIEKGLTQKQLAEELTNKGRKTSNTAIANWESGLNSPDIDTLQLICEILDKDGNYFFDMQNNESLDFKYATYKGVNLDGLTDEQIDKVNEYVEFIRNQKNKN